MYGAFIGDIVGSKYEFNNIKTKSFPLFSDDCSYTDDSIMTVAVANAILLSKNEQSDGGNKSTRDFFIQEMQRFGNKYPNPVGAYGGRFGLWLQQPNPEPYHSFGNGSAMRVSPCGLAAVTLEEAQLLARISADVSHNHLEGIKGAEAVASAVFLAKTGVRKDEIRAYIAENYYDLDFTLDEIRDSYEFDETCQGSVPQAITAFLESENFEDAIRNTISIGGDCDTTGAITGSIAWTYYIVQENGYVNWANGKMSDNMREIKERTKRFLPTEFQEIAEQFHEIAWRRAGIYNRDGYCSPILSDRERAIWEGGRNI